MSAESDAIYARVHAAWGEHARKAIPVSLVERVVKDLWKFGTGRTLEMPVIKVSGRRRSYASGGRFKVNPGSGWASVVHGVSHSAHLVRGRKEGERRHHSPRHALLELAMVQRVVDKGWLDIVEPVKERPRLADVQALRARRIDERIKGWEAKLKRAERALKKLRQQQRYYAKALSQQACDSKSP